MGIPRDVSFLLEVICLQKGVEGGIIAVLGFWGFGDLGICGKRGGICVGFST